jgi:hypothetical protein
MKQFWAQLRPTERRWVIGIGCLVFIVLNYFFVWPRFKEWHTNSLGKADANRRIAMYQAELARQAEYEKAIKNFEGGSGSLDIPLEDQILSFATFYQGRALENGVQIQSDSPRPPRTNEFFMEQQTTLDIVGGEKNLVGFLYSLGSSSSIMRVREMSLHAIEPNRYQLRASITIVASYQKKAPSKAAPAKPAGPRPPVQPQVPFDYIPNAVRTPLVPMTRSNQPPTTPRGGPASGNSRTNALSPTNKAAPAKH